MTSQVLGVFVALAIIAVLIFDLGFVHKRDREDSFKSAALWSLFWIAFAFIFNGVIYLVLGPKPALEFLSGYLVEKSLSVDNLFVFLLIFTYFQVPRAYQHKVLFWGIIGAVVFRGLLISGGLLLIEKYHWLTYVLGASLVITGIKASAEHSDGLDLENKRILKLLRKLLPLTPNYCEHRFFVREHGKLLFTPLFVVLVIVETTDIVFALDSIPAIIGITRDPFVLYTSNLFAILGLRALYFVLSGLMERLKYLKYGVSVILVFVGIKMLIADLYHLGPGVTLTFIASVLTISGLASVASTGTTTQKL